MANRILNSVNPIWIWVLSMATFVVGYVLTDGELRDALLLAIWVAVLAGFQLVCTTFSRGVISQMTFEMPNTVKLDQESIHAIRDSVIDALNHRNNQNREN